MRLVFVLAILLVIGNAIRFATFATLASDPGPTAVAAVPPPIVRPSVAAQAVEAVEPPPAEQAAEAVDEPVAPPPVKAQAVEPVAPPPVVDHPQPDLVARGDRFMAAHDLTSARLCYRRAAEAGDIEAETKLRELAAR
jgi:type IV secretory pathway VirB10-like protein